MRILSRTPGSILWLYRDNDFAVQNLRLEATKRGVDPERLLFAEPLPQKEHLTRISFADLFLDTYPYNAHTTASDAIWAGLPLLTLRGHSFASRVGASLLSSVGLSCLVARSFDEFETLAAEFAANREWRESIRATLSEQRDASPLFDATLFARGLESAYDEIWSRFRRGLAAEHVQLTFDR